MEALARRLYRDRMMARIVKPSSFPGDQKPTARRNRLTEMTIRANFLDSVKIPVKLARGPFSTRTELPAVRGDGSL